MWQSSDEKQRAGVKCAGMGRLCVDVQGWDEVQGYPGLD